MKWKSVGAAFLLFCALLLTSCAFLFYKSIPPIEFYVECDRGDIALHVLSMSRGSHEKREDGVIVADIPPGKSDITFSVQSGTQTSQFVARTSGSTCFKGPMFHVLATYGFGGGMWLASEHPHQDNYWRFRISGVAASPTAFVIGRFGGKGWEKVPLIEKFPPYAEVQLAPNWSDVVVTGHGGASVFVEGHDEPWSELDIFAALGSSIIIEQWDDRQELEVGSSLPIRVALRPGRAKVRWFPAGSDESHVEVSIGGISDKWAYGLLSLSSMLDK
jgi:hypothetical protein